MACPDQNTAASGPVIVRAGQYPVTVYLDPDSDEITWFASEELAGAALALADAGDLSGARALGRVGEPILMRPVDEDFLEWEYFWTEEEADAAITDDDIKSALDTAGSWSDLGLDWEEVEAELYRIRHSSPPTPPIEFDFDEDE